MKSTIFLTLVCLLMAGCGGGSGGGGSADKSGDKSAVGITGSFAFDVTEGNGDTRVFTLELIDGIIISKNYFFAGGNFETGIYAQATGTYAVNGNMYSAVYNYTTCDHSGGSEIWNIMPVDENHISIKVDGSDYIFYRVDAVGAFLQRAGMSVGVEQQGC